MVARGTTRRTRRTRAKTRAMRIHNGAGEGEDEGDGGLISGMDG